MAEQSLPYEVKARETVATTDDLRVTILTLGEGHRVPWHTHTDVTDTFICLEGPMVVETRDPAERNVLEAGGMVAVPPGMPHEVSGIDNGPCRFAIVQGVGRYDFVPAE